MANCNGSTTPMNNNCFSSNSSSISKINCGCTPCDTPVIIHQGDVSTQVLVPVVADVIQNCMCINKYETAYPANLVFQTNLLKTGTNPASGPICITGVTYSYDCIGVGSQASSTTSTTPVPPVPTISSFVDSKSVTLSGTAISCTCKDVTTRAAAAEEEEGADHPTTTTTTITNIYNNFSGSIKTPSCCCNMVDQPYALTKLVEKNVSLFVCNLSISLTGTIGGTDFTANLIGTGNATNAVTDLPKGLSLFTLGFPQYINFAGRLCLPTNTKLTISEEFDNCIIVDCIRPMVQNYTATADPNSTNYARFVATGDLSLVLNKQIFATTTEKLAVMTNSGAQVVCTDGATTTPACPPLTPCKNAKPCPDSVARSTTV